MSMMSEIEARCLLANFVANIEAMRGVTMYNQMYLPKWKTANFEGAFGSVLVCWLLNTQSIQTQFEKASIGLASFVVGACPKRGQMFIDKV